MFSKIVQIWKIGKLYVSLTRAGLSVYEMYKRTDGRISIRVAPGNVNSTSYPALAQRLHKSRQNDEIISVVEDLEFQLNSENSSLTLYNDRDRENMILERFLDSMGFNSGGIDIEPATYGSRWITMQV